MKLHGVLIAMILSAGLIAKAEFSTQSDIWPIPVSEIICADVNGYDTVSISPETLLKYIYYGSQPKVTISHLSKLVAFEAIMGSCNKFNEFKQVHPNEKIFIGELRTLRTVDPKNQFESIDASITLGRVTNPDLNWTFGKMLLYGRQKP